MTEFKQKERELLTKLDRMHSEAINTYKYVHIAHNDKFVLPMIEFFRNFFDMKEHCFIYYGGVDKKTFPIPNYDNVFEIFDINNITFGDGIDKIICNGLFNTKLVTYLYAHNNLLNKAYWIIWGGDLYEFYRCHISDFVRRNMRACGDGLNDAKSYRRILNKDNKFFPIKFISPITLNDIQSVVKEEKDYVQIQINNSAHYSTIEVLHNLFHFREQNIRIYTILSYGQREYAELIINVGKSFFGDKFFALTQYMQPEKYITHLANNDILILNHSRQQGMTSAHTSFLLGKKIFTRDVVKKDLRREGYRPESTEHIMGLSFDQLCSNPHAEENMQAAKCRFDDNHIRDLWANLFDA